MANAKQCDICGKFYMPLKGGLEVKTEYGLTLTHFPGGMAFLDLCPNCIDAVNLFVKTMKENNDES